MKVDKTVCLVLGFVAQRDELVKLCGPRARKFVPYFESVNVLDKLLFFFKQRC